MKVMEYFMLRGKVAEPVDLATYAMRFKRDDDTFRVGDTTVGAVRVSTVFLGLNHEYNPNKPPLIFETMTFGEPYDNNCWRYSTWEEAESGHNAIVAALQAGLELPDVGS